MNVSGVYERVYQISQYEDGPIAGVADLQGHPHFFEKEFDESIDGYLESYRLSPVAPETASLAAERKRIEEPWWIAHYGGQQPDGDHRVMPADLPRFLELERLLAERLQIDPLHVLRRKAVFRRAPDFTGGLFPPIQVMWILEDVLAHHP
jgi:hypothetical protein